VKQLLLFDIDGTLVDTAGAGLGALQSGMRDAFPDRCTEPLPALDLRGATDAGVIRQLFSACHIEITAANRQRFIEAYLKRLRAGLAQPAGTKAPCALPGVEVLLKSLARQPGNFVIGLLTGNLEEGAFTKLRHFALDTFFRFGAYGLDREQRIELGPVALERALAITGRRFAGEEAVIIGDTPRDVECAKAFGARCLAVTTGGYSAAEMEPYAPDVVLPNLACTETVLRAFASWRS
jgi:phosphoglycolate phosphatase-like HAD superfamily hydrolase